MNGKKPTRTELLNCEQVLQSNVSSPAIPIAEPQPWKLAQGAQVFPASYTQLRLWFLQRLQPDLTAYQWPALWRLEGYLDLSVLEFAFAALIKRHPTLRTSFGLEGSEVRQILHPPAPFPLSAEPIGDRDPEAVIEAWFKQESSIPFDLSSGVLLRARLLAIDSKKHLLLINHHHIASDLWSCSILARDLCELYNARQGGRRPELKELIVQYKDYAVWQRQRLSASRGQELKDYWTAALADLEPLELPSDKPRPAYSSHQGASHSFQIEPNLLAPFEQLCRTDGATLQIGLLAIVAVLLHRYCRQDDFAIGVPVWGRNHPELEHLIGSFINTLPIRTHFSPELTFRQILAQIKDTYIEAYEHQEFPFEQMLEAVRVERDSSRNPLVQVMLQLIELPEESLYKLDGLEVQCLPALTQSSTLDLEFTLRRRHDGGLQANLVYAKNLFEAARIERFCVHLIMLITSALKAPDTCADTLNFLPEVERVQIESWQNGPKMERPDLCVHQLFEQQAERNPEATALIFDDQETTYAELNFRANRLAHHLIELGVGPEIIVAVYLDRSVELIVSLLAILKAGGAYLPLDPEWPMERIGFILEDSDPLALIVHGSALRQLGDLAASVNTIDIAADAMLWSETISINPVPEFLGLNANNLAYVIYTSGSTGKPKGVLNAHHAVVNRLLWMQAAYSLCSDDTVLQKTPYSFDVSVWEFFWTLHAGARLVIASPKRHKDPIYLANIIISQGITTMHFVPSMLKAFLAYQSNINTAALRLVFCSGESLSPALVEDFYAVFPNCELHNLYGPTEAAVDVTSWACLQKNSSSYTVPIGRPISNTSIYVLGAHDLPVPVGVAGELCIGGVQVARGYLNRPDLTADRFVPDPFSTKPDGRMYRSGDLARWMPDGNLEYLGRLDFQVKLRGFRIEPGEIEETLCLHPGVSQAVVMLRQEDPANPRLIAYWVAALGRTPSVNQLRDFLGERLPEYAVPAAFVKLDILPLTTSGKLDRKALPAPSFAGDSDQRTYPSTQLERQLHEVWADVLGHSEFGCEDNFWMVGGHSLAAASLICQIEQSVGRPIAWEVIYRYPTIFGQSAWLQDCSPAAPRHLVTLQPQGSRPPLYIVHGWGGRVGSFTDLARALAPDRPVLGLQASPDAAQPLPGTSVAQMTQAYADEILASHPGGPIHLMGFSAGGWYAYAVAAALLQRQAQVGVLVLLDTQVTVQIDPRLGLALLTLRLLSKLRGKQRPTQAPFRLRHLKERLIEINSMAGLYFGVRIPTPQRFAAWLQGVAPPLGRGEPYVQLLMGGYRPPRLPIVVDLFSPQAHLPFSRRLWRFYALGGVRCWPLFVHHNDYEKPELVSQLANAVDHALTSMETSNRT